MPKERAFHKLGYGRGQPWHTFIPSRLVDNRQWVLRVLIVALGLNITMSLLKLLVGAMSVCLAVIADGINSATDAPSSITGLVTIKLSDPRPDSDYPYGHRTYEAVGALGIADFILFTGIEILLRSWERLLEGLPPIRVKGQELVLGFNFLLAGYELREGRLLNSNLLKADAQHAASDVWTTGMMLVGKAKAV